MFVYERKVSFIGYYINGIRSGSVGIVRQKVSEDMLWLKVEWCGKMNTEKKPHRLGIADATGKETGLELLWDENNNPGIFQIPIKELPRGKSRKIIFYFDDDRYGIADLSCVPEDGMREKNMAVEDEEENTAVEKWDNNTEVGGEDKTQKSAVKDEAMPVKDEISEALEECLQEQPDKWEMIKRKYPILYPFKGQGPYVSIKPVDLQLLNPKYHELSSNSYLMHGFYRYRHMILGEYTMEKGTFFYVGVPGEFIKKEQTSAAMFGFEGYEHSGDLGYYLYRVEL